MKVKSSLEISCMATAISLKSSGKRERSESTSALYIPNVLSCLFRALHNRGPIRFSFGAGINTRVKAGRMSVHQLETSQISQHDYGQG